MNLKGFGERRKGVQKKIKCIQERIKEWKNGSSAGSECRRKDGRKEIMRKEGNNELGKI